MRTIISRVAQHPWAWVMPVILVPLIYWQALSIPFYYSEVRGIQNSSVATSIETFQERMLTPKGLTQRPISVLSYALNHEFLGASPEGYHLVNIIIHLLNTFLLFQLAARLAIPPLPASLLFAVHPLATATTSQIFGRNYSLATFFLLVALNHLVTKQAWNIKGFAFQACLFLLMILTKQTLAIYPLLAFWILYCQQRIKFKPKILLLLTIAIVPSLVLVKFYAEPLSSTATISRQDFLFSQLGNWSALSSFFILPFQTALLHDLPLFSGFDSLEVIVGSFILLAVLLFLGCRRYFTAGLLLGSFLLLLSPTNTFFPKNEIVREWRLYPSLVFFCLIASHIYSVLLDKFRHSFYKNTLSIGGLTILALMTATVINQNKVYQNHKSTWQQVTSFYPHSADAWNNLALAVGKTGDYERAISYLENAINNKPEISRYYQNSALFLAKLGKNKEANEMAAKGAMVHKVFGNKFQAVHFQGDLSRIKKNRASMGIK